MIFVWKTGIPSSLREHHYTILRNNVKIRVCMGMQRTCSVVRNTEKRNTVKTILLSLCICYTTSSRLYIVLLWSFRNTVIPLKRPKSPQQHMKYKKEARKGVFTVFRFLHFLAAEYINIHYILPQTLTFTLFSNNVQPRSYMQWAWYSCA